LSIRLPTARFHPADRPAPTAVIWIERPDLQARATRIVTLGPHPGSREQVQAPTESQACAVRAAAPSTSRTARTAAARFPAVLTRGVGADRTSQTQPGPGRG